MEVNPAGKQPELNSPADSMGQVPVGGPWPDRSELFQGGGSEPGTGLSAQGSVQPEQPLGAPHPPPPFMHNVPPTDLSGWQQSPPKQAPNLNPPGQGSEWADFAAGWREL